MISGEILSWSSVTLTLHGGNAPRLSPFRGKLEFRCTGGRCGTAGGQHVEGVGVLALSFPETQGV
ncbi:hypothetical protein [Streptomyces celluloflavus]|uniref:hypothetical protein n=1 Tax=Streptomyces celluloflavus TaxID=58344 RepID=UPI00345FFAA5